MKTSKIIFALLVGICLTASVFANDEKSTDPDKRKAMHEEMQAEMKAMDEKLDKLVIDMNAAATPEKKLDAAIAVINEMVAQHKKMHEKMHRWGESRHHGPSAGKEGEKN